VDTRIERIVLETDRHRIVGNLTLPRDGYRSRLSDYLNQGEIAFIPLTEAEIEVIEEPGAPEVRDFIAVAREHVQLAYPAGNGTGSGSLGQS
jgi:hypothetical protein